MKKTLALFTVALLLSASGAMAADTLTFTPVTTSGSPAGPFAQGSSFSFTITLNVTSTAPNAMSDVLGLSYWFATSAADSSFFTITRRDVGASPFDTIISPSLHSDGTGAGYPQAIAPEPGVGHGGNPLDLGATASGGALVTNASYFVATITIHIAANTPVGPHNIFTTSLGSNPSEANNSAFAMFNLPVSTFFFSVSAAVPEPATWSLILLGGLGAVGVNLLRGRRRS